MHMAKRNKPGPKPGSKKTAAHKLKLAKAVEGKKNGRYKTGRRSYRRIAGAKSGEVVDHIDGNRDNNSPDNLRRLKAKKAGATTTSAHEKKTDRNQGRKPGSKNKKTNKQKMSLNIKDYKLFGTKKG